MIIIGLSRFKLFMHIAVLPYLLWINIIQLLIQNRVVRIIKYR